MKELDPLKVFADPNLLGQFLRDLSTWEAWLAFVCAVFGRKPFNQKRRDLFNQCAGGRKWPTRQVAEAWVSRVGEAEKYDRSIDFSVPGGIS